MDIQIVAVDKQTKADKNGKPFMFVELSFKNLTYQGKLESFKVNQYSKAYNTAAGCQAGQLFTVEREKSKEGFWQWNALVQKAPGTEPSTSKPAVSASTGVQRSTYETSEERAKKQVYIVKQSSISNAIELLSIGAKIPPSTGLVLQEAQKLVDWVFEDNTPQVSLIDMPNDDIQVE